MNPGNLDHLEDRVLSAMYKLGSCLMESKISDWNTQLRHKTCPECVTKLIHKQKKRQIATWVCDVNYKRWRSYCPKCRNADYPLDRMLGIGSGQRLSSSVQELSALSGENLDEVKSVVRGDGAPFIRGFHSKYVPLGRCLLDYYHLCKKVRERLWAVYDRDKRFREVKEKLMNYLNAGDVDGALEYLRCLNAR